MSVVQALAAMLSAGADASSRLGAASLAANASNANANAALQGDIYRSNTQGQIANRGIDSENQRAAAEMALRGRLANNQMGLESGRLALQRQQLGLGREQLGLNRQQLNQERDFRLGEMGQGQYAPKVPDMGQVDGDVIKALKGVLAGRANGAADGDIIEAMNGVLAASGAGADSGNLQDYAKKMIMANPGNQRVLATWGPILNQGSQQQQWQQEFDWKKGAMSDPNVLFGALAPHILGMEGMTPDRMSPALQQLRASLGIGAKAPAAATAPGALPTFTEAQAALPSMTSGTLFSALGIDDKIAPEQFLEKIIPKESGMWQTHKSPILKDPAAREQLQQYIRNRAAIDPNFLTPQQSFFGANADTMTRLLKAILEGSDVQDAARQGYGGGAQSGPRLMPLGY